MKNHILLKLLLAIVGLTIMAFGIALLTVQSLGSYPVEALTFNVLHFIPQLTVFWVSFLYNIIFVIPLALYQIIKKKINFRILIVGIIPAVVLSIPIDFFVSIFNQADTFLWRIIFMISGFLVCCFGISLFQVTNIFNFYNMELCEVLSEDTKISFFWFRVANDGLALLIGFILILNGANRVLITPGTIFLTLGTGPFIDFFMRLLRKNPLINSFRK